MRLLLAGTLATLTAAGLAAIRPALLTDEERATASTIRENRMRADVRFLSSDLLEGRGPATRAIDSPANTSPRVSRRSGSSRGPPEGAGSRGSISSGHRRLSRGAARLGRRGRHGPAIPRGLRRVLGSAGRGGGGWRTPRSCSSATASWPRSTAGTTTRGRPEGPRPARASTTTRRATRSSSRASAGSGTAAGTTSSRRRRGRAPPERSSSTPTPRPATAGRWCRPRGPASS